MLFTLRSRERQTEPSGAALLDTLTEREKKQTHSVIEEAKRDDGIPRTAQQSISFQRMFLDDIHRVSDRYYTKAIQFQDINCQLVQQEDKTSIFEEWYDFLSFFDSSIHFELSLMDMATDMESFERRIQIQPRQDSSDDIRQEYSQMLHRQLERGDNGLAKAKYLTFGIETESTKQIGPRLEHVQTDLFSNSRRLGVSARILNGKERPHLMYSMLHMDDHDKFYFDWRWLPISGLSIKGFTMPSSFSFPGGKTSQMGSLYEAMSFLSITTSDLSDQLLKDFLDMGSNEIVTVHIQSVDQNKAIKTIEHTITELDRSRIGKQKKTVRSGYDIGIILPDLATYGEDTKALLKELQS